MCLIKNLVLFFGDIRLLGEYSPYRCLEYTLQDVGKECADVQTYRRTDRMAFSNSALKLALSICSILRLASCGSGVHGV